MAETGVLPFVRGLDLTGNEFADGSFPTTMKLMTGMQWLKLDRTGTCEIPPDIGKLVKLENLSLKHNNLEKLYGEITELHCLRSLNLRRNKVKSSGLPSDLFKLEELTTLDLSFNKLKDIPDGLDKAKSLLVLNLSNNMIETIPPTLFIQLTDLLFLDLSDNHLETLPPQTRRLTNLQTLILNNNPLGLFQLRQLPSLLCLETLHMRNTQRTLANVPSSLESLSNLSDLDLSRNMLPKIPDSIYLLVNLKRLNMSENELTEISSAIDSLQKLETLNLSRNKLTALPNTLCKMLKLRKLYVNDNLLDFEGIPSGIGKLSDLETFSAANNRLEMIPEGLCRCGSLKKLNLSCNRLITLPDAIHLFTDLEQLDLRNNPDLLMPPKPQDGQKGSGVEFYNIDFSLQNQLRLAGASVPAPTPATNPSKDSIARKLRLRRGRREEGAAADQDQAKILKGMQDVTNTTPTEEQLRGQSLKPKKWDEALEKPPLDYSEFFDDDAGQVPGLSIWEIENFLPNMIDEVAHGKFYEGDCYIVLKTSLDEQGQLMWEIHFWIGEKASLDKRACAAIHAVHLRNYLGASGRTMRQEQGDETPEFIQLFSCPLTYIQGGRTASGFFTIEDTHYVNRMYRIHGSGSSIHMEPVPLTIDSLDPRYVFLLDVGLNIFLWFGKTSKNTIKSKTRLFAEKINKNDRKNKAELISENQGSESVEFLKILGFEEDRIALKPPVEHVKNNFTWKSPRLYRVELGMGYLELPQVESPFSAKLKHTLLTSRNVYILDCYLDVFVWFGKKSTRLVRAAAVKLSQELFNMIDRPSHALITRLQEGTEHQVFKSHFQGWDEVIAVDFTRTAESVARTGADLTRWAKQQDTKADLTALFTPRQASMTSGEAQQLAEEWAEDLEAMEAFVLEGRKFGRLPQEELGIFYTGDCYVFLCKYVIPRIIEVETEQVEVSGGDRGEHKVSLNSEQDVIEEDTVQWVVYFWQGRNAGNMGWLTFTFGLEKKFKSLCHNLEVERMHQQQESVKFLSHFNRKFVIKDGKRKQCKKVNGKSPVELYHLRSNGSPLCTRLVQVRADATLLNSAFCYILNVPFESANDVESGIIYVWIGSKSDPDEARLIEQIAEDVFNSPWVSLQVLTEGSEPDNFFWVALGGQKPYDQDAEFMNYTRLFRCSNEKGYFTVSEKCSDFCQDDLADDDIMILDNGEHVFLWLGSKCSEVEIKLAYKSAQVYIQHLRVKQPERPRKLFLTLKNKESKRFTKCFHGWGPHKKALE